MNKALYYVKPHRKLLIEAVAFLAVQNFSSLYLLTLTAGIINIGVANGDLDFIYKSSVIMLLVAVLGGAGSILSTIFSSRFTASFSRDLREAVFIKAQQYSLSDFQTFGTASMITRCTNDITILQRSCMTFLRVLLRTPIIVIIGLALAFNTNIRMACIILTILIIFGIFAYLLSRKSLSLFKQIPVKMDRLTHILREIITGVRVIRAFNREKFEKNRLNHASEDFSTASIRLNKVFAILLPLLFLLLDLSTVCILWFGGIEISKGSMPIGSIFALAEYMTIILFSTIMAALMFMEIPRALACMARINAVLELTPEMETSADGLKSGNQGGILEFRDVTFRYPGAEMAVLSHLSFTARPGEITAIIGGTGSGKSTIANLIPRFYTIQEGEILIDGINIANYPQRELRDKIGLIPQKTFLFRGTIESNIKYGKENASMEEVEYAAKIAQAHDFITGLANGYQAFVAQGGTNLSGGQKQRIAIARALVKKPEIYVFDDSFSALDFKTDAMLRQALCDQVRDATVIIIAQRISTIMEADQIVVLDEGRMVGIGQHSELTKSCPVYQQIAFSQLNEAELLKKEGY